MYIHFLYQGGSTNFCTREGTPHRISTEVSRNSSKYYYAVQKDKVVVNFPMGIENTLSDLNPALHTMNTNHPSQNYRH